MYLSPILILCLIKFIHAKLQPDSVYDMRGSFDNGEIKSEHLIKCGDTKNWMDINFTSVDSNGWFQWNTHEKIKHISISANGSSNEWLYVVYDADLVASQKLLSAANLVEMCHECAKGTSTNSIDINFDNKAFSHSRGRYWIGADGNFIISLQCTYYENHELHDEEIIMAVLTLIVVALFVSGCVAGAIWKNYQYKKRKKEARKMKKTFSKKALETAIQLTETGKHDDDIYVDNDENEFKLADEIAKDEEEENEILVKAVISKNILYEDILKTIDETIEDEDLDAYQILAFRHNYDEPRKLGRSFFMFRFTRYQQSLFTVLITSSLQIFGITVTLYSVAVSYFEFDDNGSADCEWQMEIWITDWPYKILAFLWAWIISLSVAIYANSVETIGLNELVKLAKKLSIKESDDEDDKDEFDKYEYYMRLNLINQFVNIRFLELGVVINYYTLTLAILGSFFLIYESEAGSDALDMILNAVALYFMIELDDMFVSKKDIRDLKRHKKQMMQSIINKFSTKDFENIIGSKTKCALRCSAIVKYIAYTLIVIAIIIAPFAILTCW